MNSPPHPLPHLASPAQTQPKAPLAAHRLRFLADLNATTADEAARELVAYAPRDAMETALAEQITTLRAVLRHFATRALGPHSSPAMALRALSAVSSLQRVLLSTQSALDRRQRKPLPAHVAPEATAEAATDAPRDQAHPEPSAADTRQPAAREEPDPAHPGETGPPLPEPGLARRMPAFTAELEAASLPREALLTFARAPVPLRKAGLEWAWRLAMEPRRLARRYLLGNAEFLARLAWLRLASPDTFRQKTAA